MKEKKQTFLEIFNTFRSKQELNNQDPFSAACCAFLKFENTNNQATRLSILYILYSYYASLPLHHNPFLTFFLQLIDDLPSSSTEQHFVYCILENSLSYLDNKLPQDVSDDPNNKLPVIQKKKSLIDSLKLKVARLIDDPNIVILNEQVINLLSSVCSRVLTISENEMLRNERLLDYPLTKYISPNQLPKLIDLNQFIALDIVPILLKTNYATLYLQSLLNVTVTVNSLEVIHCILIMHHMQLSQEFLHYYISNSIRSCDQLEEEGPKKDRQVKQVARFIQSLVEKGIISMADYFIEIQSFCVSYMKYKNVTNLFRLASSSRQHNLLNQQRAASSV
ncbi:uncharacterized protein BX663DRAFT_516610 [Cokeromyces recurvatus]|uniref:uncharacterized protein n=1 Tax=Cokeromyces recurvatus TaxID=90255 RepID=UPI00221E9C50|nr:uncharacterized protein BX663DRAFT_516610 [Cokeromyces recurvatus]KAI7900812.1 hypothetical protein BX663DRAFT_516610 [Cokeromyces recurvatus]